MKRDYPEQPLIGVGAVIVSGGRALLVRRDSEPLRGEWSVPGGLLELGERLDVAMPATRAVYACTKLRAAVQAGLTGDVQNAQRRA